MSYHNKNSLAHKFKKIHCFLNKSSYVAVQFCGRVKDLWDLSVMPITNFNYSILN